MEHRCVAEMGTKKSVCWHWVGEMEHNRPWQFMQKVVDIVDFLQKDIVNLEKSWVEGEDSSK